MCFKIEPKKLCSFVPLSSKSLLGPSPAPAALKVNFPDLQVKERMTINTVATMMRVELIAFMRTNILVAFYRTYQVIAFQCLRIKKYDLNND